MLIKHAGAATFPHCCFLFGPQEMDLCLTTLRSGSLCVGEKYHWSPFQVLSRAGGKDFRPNLAFSFLLKKLFVSLTSKDRTMPESTLAFSAVLQKLSIILIKCNAIYWALLFLTFKYMLLLRHQVLYYYVS